MKKICYIVPYFGILPANFKLWLNSCATNPTVDWLIYTDDKTQYDYPKNVRVIYCTFEDIKQKIQSHFDFEILLDRPWKLCDYKVAYGEIFEEDLKLYDFWGHCDLDLLWGDIRSFMTDTVLEKYEKIGFQGHSTLYKNTPEVNSRYKLEFDDLTSYKEVFTNSKGYCFDEGGICRIYNKLNIPYYKEITFANLRKYEYNFSLTHLPENEEYKNKNQIFIWDNGKLYRKYLYNKEIHTEEFMYIHFFCRPMTYKAKNFNLHAKYLIYPECVVDWKENLKVDYKFILKKSKENRIRFFIKSIYINRKKITIKKIISNIKAFKIYKK